MRKEDVKQLSQRVSNSLFLMTMMVTGTQGKELLNMRWMEVRNA